MSTEPEIIELLGIKKTLLLDIGEIKKESKATHALVQTLGEDVRRLFFIGVVLASAASALLLGLKLYDTWASVRERELAQQEARRYPHEKPESYTRLAKQ